MLATPELLQEAVQPEQFQTEVARCVQEIPLYRDLRPRIFPASPAALASQFSSLPTITKADIRRGFPANFLGPTADIDSLVDSGEIELEHTSGTSEERTPLLLPKGWWAEQELRALNLNENVAQWLRQSPSARRATINSPVCSGDIRYQGVPSRDNRIVGNSLFVSLSRFPFLWGEKELSRIASEIVDWDPEFLDVDPVYGVVFALHCERNQIRLPSLKFILCSYEYVSVVHRSIIERVFQVPVLDLYGSTETGHLLMQDEQDEMRPSLRTALFEVIERDDSGIGDLVVTTLSNPIMPLIRYRIGDLVEFLERPYGTRYILHGRSADAFRLSKGNRVTIRQVDQIFAGLTGIAHYQLVQRLAANWTLRIVPEMPGHPPAAISELQDRLSPLLGSPDSIEVQISTRLGPEKSGKFRLGYPSSPA
jgi:phenylacetate-CoA ligase